MSCEEFAGLVRERLEGLHGLHFVDWNERGWTCTVFLANATTGVELVWEERIRVLIGRLVDGRLAGPADHIGSTTRIGAHDLEAIMYELGDSTDVGAYEMSENHEVALGNVIAALDRVVGALDRYGSDLLEGDFTVFQHMDEVVRARAAAQREGRPIP
jgi:hypothetical protein